MCKSSRAGFLKMCELMLCGPVVESVEGCQKHLHHLRSNDKSPGAVGCFWVGWVQRAGGMGTLDLEANTELRHSAFSQVKSTVVPCEVREGMEAEHTSETG